jgi:hypothetical protein
MKHHPLRVATAVGAAALLALLAACGPGVGGSGTGLVDGPPVGPASTPAYVCASELAPVLACDPASATSAAALVRGTAPVGFAAIVNGQAVLVRLEGNRIAFSAGCTALRFAGSWGTVGTQEARFQGFVDPNGNAAPATLSVQRDGDGLWLLLRAADGTPLYGPLRVAPASGALPCE